MLSQLRLDFHHLIAIIRQHWRAILITIFATTLCLLWIEKQPLQSLLTSYLPTFAYDRWSSIGLFYYGFLPFLFGLIICQMTPSQMGLGLGKWRSWLPSTLLFLIIALPLVAIASHWSSFQHYYGRGQFDFTAYLISTTIFLAAWEFFFRGFLLFGLKPSLGLGSIIVQMIPFTLLHIGKPLGESIMCIFSGLIWGYICYRGESFWPALIMHLAVNILLKSLSIGYI